MFKDKIKLLRSSFFVSAFTTFSTIFAFLVQLILAKEFGADFQMDAYFAAVAIPMLLVKLLGTPLSTVFVPLYKNVKYKENKAKTDAFYSSLFIGFFVFYLIIAAFIFISAFFIARWLIPGASYTTIQLTASLLRIAAFYLFFLGLYFTTQTLHIAEDSFFFPYLGNAFSSFSLITYTFVMIPYQGIYAPVYGLLLGAIIEFVISYFSLPRKINWRFQFDKDIYRSFLKLFLPLGIGSLIYKSTPVIDKYFASFLLNGDISVISYGQRFLESLNGFLAMGFSVVMLSVSSRLAAKKETGNFNNTLSWSIRATGLLIIPVCFYLAFFGTDLIKALFQRGQFTPELSLRVGQILAIYSIALFGLGLSSQLTNIFYAKKKHLKLVLINLMMMAPYIILVKFFSERWGTNGIGFAYAIQTSSITLIYIFWSFRYLRHHFPEMIVSFTRFTISSLLMIATIWLVKNILPDNFNSLTLLLLETLVGFVTYTFWLYVFKAKEVLALIHGLQNKTK